MFNRVDLSVPPSQRAGFSMNGEIEEKLRELLTPIAPLAGEANRALFHLTRTYWPRIEDRARSSIFNHAVNDFTSLISQLWLGDGRNAARTSRSLYEHLVNYCWVAAHDEAKERYIGHEAVTLDLLSKMRRGVMLLGKSQRKREIHRLRKISNSNRPDLLSAYSKYGNSFGRDWSATPLRERAEMCGFGSSYDTYRLLSQVTHGSFGGTLGTQQLNKTLFVHRVGPSLELAVLSYLEGLSFFRDLGRRISVIDGVSTRELVDALNQLIGAWPTYKHVCSSLDRQIWPTNPPMQATAILAFYPQGGTRWFLWEPEFSVVTPTVPPKDAESHERRSRELMGEQFPGIFSWDGEQKPVTIAVHGISLMVSTNSKWYPAEAILQSPTGGAL